MLPHLFPLNSAAVVLGNELHAVADAKNGYVQGEDCGIIVWSICIVDAVGATRDDDGPVEGEREGEDLVGMQPYSARASHLNFSCFINVASVFRGFKTDSTFSSRTRRSITCTQQHGKPVHKTGRYKHPLTHHAPSHIELLHRGSLLSLSPTLSLPSAPPRPLLCLP